MGSDATSVSTGLHTALHELVHILGGVGPGISAAATPFVNATGGPLDPADVWTVGTDTGYGGKPVTYISTPRVRAVARAAFGCDSLPGFPVEDYERGRGVHWEVWGARRSLGRCIGFFRESSITHCHLPSSIAGPLGRPRAHVLRDGQRLDVPL